ncbi:MAG: hypothetical protein HRU38_17345 [Saccharospirillaceae bacterium]|nr:hypothetical protein [Pseudomonadales bacterium]NRB80404.1 hypothetical protein [Saccharospirillaceae bacterium]
MLDNHDSFINEVINKAKDEDAKEKIKELNKKKEEVTIESLVEVSGLSKEEVTKIMEETRSEKKNNHLDSANNIVEQVKNHEVVKQIINHKLVKQGLAFIKGRIYIVPVALIVLFMVFKNIGGSDSVDVRSDTVNVQSDKKTKSVKTTSSDKKKVKTFEYSRETRDKHTALMSAINAGDVQVAKHLLAEENVPMYIPRDDSGNLSENYDPIIRVAWTSDNTMLKMLLEQGANPFYSFRNYERATSIVREKRNELFLTIMFNHLVKLDSTPEAMKKLWEMEIPFTKDAVSKAYKDRNFEALALFSDINLNEFTHFWLEHSWATANNNNDIEAMDKFYEILITNQKHKNKVSYATSKGMMMAMTNRNHALVEKIFALGVNPNVRASDVYGKRGVRMHNNQSKLNLFNIAVLYNYDEVVKKLLEDGYEMTKKEAEDIFSFMLSTKIPPSTDSTSFHRTIKALVDYGLPVNGKHIEAFAGKVGYAKHDQIEEYSQTMSLLVDQVDILPINEKLLSAFIQTNNMKGIKNQIESGVGIDKGDVSVAIRTNNFELADFLLDSLSKTKRETLEVEFKKRNSYSVVKYITKEESGNTKDQMKVAIKYLQDNNLFDETNTRLQSVLKKLENS